MSKSSDAKRSMDDQAQRDALAAAREQLARATADHEAMLSDEGTIQEDRDAAAQFVVEARAAVARAETALARIEAGTYGRCERCGSPIPSERLAVLADAVTCVSCA